MMFKDSQVGKSWSAAVASGNLQLVGNFCLSIGVVVLIMMLFFKEAEIIAVPEQQIFGELSVQGKKANRNYQQSWALSTAQLIGNITPENVDFVKSSLMNVLSPLLKFQIEPMLEKQSEVIRMRGIKQVFIAEDLIHEPSTDLITIWGQKLTFIDGTPKSDSKWSYEFKIEVRHGRPRITHIDQYPGTPRKRKQAMEARNQAPPENLSSQPYYDSELEIAVLEAAQDLKEKEAKATNEGETNEN